MNIDRFLILNRQGAQALTEKCPGRINVITITSRHDGGEFPLPKAKSQYTCWFDDVGPEEITPEDAKEFVVADIGTIQRAVAHALSLSNAYLILHCHAGISRSPAVAIGILYHHFKREPNPAQRTLQKLLAIQPYSYPKLHVMRLALRSVTETDEQAEQVMQEMLKTPEWKTSRSSENSAGNPLIWIPSSPVVAPQETGAANKNPGK